MPDPISWLIIAICIVGHFFFSLAETSLACCNRFELQVEAENSKTAKLIVHVCERYDRALTTILIGNNIVAIIVSTVSALLFLSYFKGTGLESSSSIISSIIMSIIVYILGDSLPKTIAKAIPNRCSKIVIYPIYGLMFIFFPIAKLFEVIVNLIERLFKVKNDEEFTQQDFENVVEQGEVKGEIEEEQAEIIQSALEFNETSVKEVLTPKEKMFALDVNGLSKEKLDEVIVNSSYSRIPLYKGEIDNIIGTLLVKTYVKETIKDPNIPLRKMIQKPYFVSSRISLISLFDGFKKHKTHIAIVKNDDEIIGMVTMEDVLEEIVSDIGEPNIRKRKA